MYDQLIAPDESDAAEADPWFPGGGGTDPAGGALTYHFARLSKETAWTPENFEKGS